MAESVVKVASFRIGQQLYGIDLGYVQEFVEELPYTSIPGHDQHYIALANLRGQIISLLDLRQRLIGEPSENNDTLLIIRNNRSLEKSQLVFECLPTSEEAIGLIIEERGLILNLDPEDLSSPPEHGEEKHMHYVKKLAMLNDEVLIILDVQKLIDLEPQSA